MTTAFVLGSAQCVMKDWAAAKEVAQADYLVAINDMIPAVVGPLDMAVSFHAEKMPTWLRRRARHGLYEPRHTVVPVEWPDWFKILGRSVLKFTPTDLVPFFFEGQEHSGSSGLFAVKAALEVLHVDRVVCCGIPMEEDSCYLHRPREKWRQATRHRKGWEEARPHLAGRVFSMSGWTADFLGKPEG